MEYVREHELAAEHALTKAAIVKADKEIAKRRAAMFRRAKALRAKAQKMIEEAAELEYAANKYSEYETPFAVLRTEIEDAGYWAAREVIGVLPRDDAGNYVSPAPFWRVTHEGEDLGVFQGEERCDVLRLVCPKGDSRSWSEFEVTQQP